MTSTASGSRSHPQHRATASAGVDAPGDRRPDVGEQERTAAHRRIAHGGAAGGVALPSATMPSAIAGGRVVATGPSAVGRVEQRLEDEAGEVGAEQLCWRLRAPRLDDRSPATRPGSRRR